MTRAVVFAYHNVGVRCLKTVLAHAIEVPLVVTHDDNPREEIWFDSVARVAGERGIPVLTPVRGDDPTLLDRVAALAPDFLFSFYYRSMLPGRLLGVASRGALNMHGSLLPRYRGRVPVNWAILRGERETGATLHYMVAKPDAGDIVDQQRVPILPDDSAREVFDKVTVAAEIVLDRSLPGLVTGTAPRRTQDLAAGSYFGGRRPEDGRIDWTAPARRIHDLVRAVAPPYPGAFTTLRGHHVRVLRTRVLDDIAPLPGPARLVPGVPWPAVECGGGGRLALLAVEVDGREIAPESLAEALGPFPADIATAPQTDRLPTADS